jgi:serine/threonine protein kinase
MQVTLVHAYQPFTTSPVFKVHLDQTHSGQVEAVLKLFDRRCMKIYRARPHDGESEKEYQDFIERVQTGTTERIDFDDPDYDVDKENPGEFEAYLEHICHQMFENEKQTYLRLADLQGTKIPRLFNTVAFPVFRQDKSTYTVRGLLMEYIPSVTLRQLLLSWDRDKPSIPISLVPSLCDEAIAIVNLISDRSVINTDVRLENVLVRQNNSSDHPVVIIDLAQSSLRSDETEKEWKEWKRREDEEGAIGCVAEKLIKRTLGEGVWKFNRSSDTDSDDDSDSN